MPGLPSPRKLSLPEPGSSRLPLFLPIQTYRSSPVYVLRVRVTGVALQYILRRLALHGAFQDTLKTSLSANLLFPTAR